MMVILDVKFEDYTDVVTFMNVLTTEISSSMFITFENRCPVCHDMEIGHYTYIDDIPLTVGVLLEFVRHLKNLGRICEHEQIHYIGVSDIISVLRLKWS